jgi:methylglutaconyl-CoA hydratase
MSSYGSLELDIDARGFATLWLNRPACHNAFDGPMIDDLLRALAHLDQRADLRFMVLRGRGRHFCAGADLGWMQRSANLDHQANLADARRLGELMQRLAYLSLPTLAVVQGAAFGGALGLIGCCDLAIGATDARLCLSEARIGLIPAVIAPYLVQAIGERATRRYTLTAEPFDGARAQALGLFDEAYPADVLERRLEQWIATLLSNSPNALRAGKRLLREIGQGQSAATRRDACEQAIAAIRVSPEGQEGLRAFLDERPPAWRLTPQDRP